MFPTANNYNVSLPSELMKNGYNNLGYLNLQPNQNLVNSTLFLPQMQPIAMANHPGLHNLGMNSGIDLNM
jgi:hypothetical protein